MIKMTLILFLSFSMFASEAGRKRKKKPKPVSQQTLGSFSSMLTGGGGSSACTWTPPRLNPGENPITYTLPLRLIGQNQSGPIYESCAEAQRRKQKEWLARNFLPSKPKPRVAIGQGPTSCSRSSKSTKTVCESCIEKSIPAALGSFTDLLTHTDGSTGTITEQQIIGQSQACQIKNNKKVCTFCTRWEDKEVEAQAYLPHACTNNSDCTLVYTTCCGCDLGEKALAAVHVNDKNNYYKNLQDRLSCNANCHDRNFASSAECRRTAVCINGACLAAEGVVGGCSTSGGGGESEAIQ
jgi:hypothetical protein